jgi:diguanylate cyclase (GGDEF)-like protein
MERDRLAAQNQEMIGTLKGFNAELERTVEQRTSQVTETNARLTEALEEIEAKNRALVLLNESLNVLATIDGLTGLYNRREFHNRLTMEWDRFKRYGRPFSLIMIDIDHFKKVNDTHGHECGDTVLAGLGELMRQQKRRQDVVCRYGGEEFVIILAETSLDAAFKVAEKTRQLVAESDFRCGDLKIPVAISLGVASATEHRPASDTDLVKIADQGLYRAKQEGRNRTVVLEGLDSSRVRLSGG